MSLYVYAGPKKPFMMGRPLEAFSIDSLEVKGERVIAYGKLFFRDMVEKTRTELFWEAENISVAGELKGWFVFQRTGKTKRITAKELMEFQGFVRIELEQWLAKNPQALGCATKGGEPDPAKESDRVPPADDTSFPKDWASEPDHVPPQPALVNGSDAPVKIARFRVKKARPPKPSPPRIYSGSQIVYAGPCICETVEDSSPRNPFDWQAATDGKFPKRCFECSCGTKWWCNRPEEHFWIRVLDLHAWGSLCESNGVPKDTFAYQDNGLYLEETLLQQNTIIPYELHTE